MSESVHYYLDIYRRIKMIRKVADLLDALKDK